MVERLHGHSWGRRWQSESYAAIQRRLIKAGAKDSSARHQSVFSNSPSPKPDPQHDADAPHQGNSMKIQQGRTERPSGKGFSLI